MNTIAPPKIQPHDNVILFDGLCNLCHGWRRFIIRFDTKRAFKLCPMQSEKGQAILDRFAVPGNRLDAMLLVQNSRVFTKSDAFIAVISQLPFPWNLLRLIKVIPKRIRDGLYDRIAHNRYKIFGRADHCVLPPSKQSHRFL